MFNNVYNNKKILITGDTGFKGSWFAIWLNYLGADVYGYALPPKSSRDNYSVCNLDKTISHLDGDVRELNKLLAYFREVQPDIAFHFAAQPLVIDSYKDPVYTYETNLLGTVNFFEAVRNTVSVKVAVNVTSDKCYKNNEWLWGYREDDPMGGKDPYSASKGCSELITNSYMQSFFSETGTANIASVRAGNVIGGGDWAEYRIVPDFFRSLEKNSVLSLRYPEATRPWQHVLEPLSGYLNLAMKLYTHGKKFSGGWNFGPIGNTSRTVRNLINSIIDYCGKGEYEAPEYDEKFHEASLLSLDISKAVHLLDWKPVLDFEETVKMTADGYLLLGNTDVYTNRIQQIEEYSRLASAKNIKWTK